MSLDKWSQGHGAEAEYWRKVFKNPKDSPPHVFDAWFNPECPLRPEFTACIDASEGATVAILDVGAGPLTMVGKSWPGRKVVVTAVDPLASEYGAILEEAGIEPIVRTQFGEVERLRDLFPANAFDFVHMRNALDHSYDPLQGIVEMLRVVKIGSFVYLQHRPNEGVTQEYSGLHQWNFSNEDGAFAIWNDDVRINVNETVGGFAQTSARDVEGPWIEVKMRKLAEPPRSLAQSGPWRKLADIFKRR